MSCNYDKLAWKFLFCSITLILVSVMLSFFEYEEYGIIVTAVAALFCIMGLCLSFKKRKNHGAIEKEEY